ncbi:3'(2'),5'-bisphosphate nucleotidase 1-like [Salvelinus namaycush]|uniref:3'(2'),5'-bisphosphate nucleotidase 1-like n=1 Tax=Salvelinus namaycush TaxID=8040 RepID=A0A8U0P521_SALNM|nr:3'(2'),5'-bisphosphate nucleotidase 1-like [Salvelinus namaycush]XP_038818387.1 3'(2'),5'-bisphosphate nucleotidase 1-like [Salvelinus namaycush]
MSGNPAVVMCLVASAYAVAEKAGAIIRRVLHSGELGIVEKTGANDLQTLADRLVQQSICASLSKSFPKITIIGEEVGVCNIRICQRRLSEDLIESSQSEEILQKSCPLEYSALKEEELVVWVDPLDGTKEYTEGLLDHMTVLIAIAGVINQPFFNYQLGTETADMGRTLWGMPGLGAFGFELQEVPDGRRIVTTTRSHSNKLVTDTVDAMEPHDVIWRRVGGAGNKIVQLVEGKASAYVFACLGTKK